MHIVRDLGPSMAHFEADVDAIIEGSYDDLYPGMSGNRDSFSVLLIDTDGLSSCAWYHKDQMTLLCKGFTQKLTAKLRSSMRTWPR